MRFLRAVVWRRAAAALIAALSLTGGIAAPTPALADVSQSRLQTPIVAGTKLGFPSAYCTAGLVLKATGWWANLTEVRRATRYVLTAGHCGNVNDPVEVSGNRVGQVVWKSSSSDLELVRVDPSVRVFPHCWSGPSTGPVCSIANTTTPRAEGKVLMGGPEPRLTAVPVSGANGPSEREIFCTSGANSGLNCSWISHPRLPGARAGVDYAETFGGNVRVGDSGGPVVTRNAHVFGIIDSYGDVRGSLPTVMAYTRVDQFFREQPGYELAPS